MVKLKIIITFIKGPRKKKEKSKQQGQIEKHKTMNLNWWMKLKINKTFTKEPRKKLEIPRIKTKLKNIIFGKLGFNDEI